MKLERERKRFNIIIITVLIQIIFDNPSLFTPSPSTSITYFRKQFKNFSCKSNSIILNYRDLSLFTGNGGVADYRKLSVFCNIFRCMLYEITIKNSDVNRPAKTARPGIGRFGPSPGPASGDAGHLFKKKY